MSATDAILYCRGPALDNSEQYNEEKLVHWLMANMPAMRKIKDSFKRRQIPKSLQSSYEKIHSNNTGRSQLSSQINPALMKEMNECLTSCQKLPALRRKV